MGRIARAPRTLEESTVASSPCDPGGTVAMIDTIIFDAEGVVIDTEAIWDLEQEEFLRRRGLVYDRARIKHRMTGPRSPKAAVILAREYGFPGDPQASARAAGDRPGPVPRRVRFLDGFRGVLRSRPGAVQDLHRDVDAPGFLEIADRRLGLSDLFGGRLYCIADVGHRSKPDPDLFLHAARRLASPPGTCVVIEDAPLGLEAVGRG